MKYLKLFELFCYIGGMYYSLINLAEKNDIYFMAFVFVGCLVGFIIQTINLAMEKNKQV